MELHFVAMKEDAFGEKALALLKAMKGVGLKTTLLKQGQEAPPATIALFALTENGSSGTMASEGAGRRRTLPGPGGHYLCCSAVRLEKSRPNWTVTTPFWVGIKSTQDWAPEKGATFANALKTMVEMFQVWDWTSPYLVPWADTEKGLEPVQKERTLTTFREWRKQPTAVLLVNRDTQALETCRTIQQTLETGGGYYVGDPTQALQISPDLFWLTPKQLALVEQNVKVLPDFWREATALYLAALEGEPKLKWLPNSVEGPLTDEQREWQRRIARDQREVLPLFGRADLSSVWFLNELQERIGGLGLVESWVRAIRQAQGLGGVIGDPLGFAPTFAQTVQRATGQRQPVVVLVCPEGYEHEQSFFAQALRENGVKAYVVMKERLEENLTVRSGCLVLNPNGPRVDFLYRREINAASMALTAIGRRIMATVLAGKLIVEPPLNMLYDCKTPLAWVNDRRTRPYFSEAVRRVITSTALMPNEGSQPFRLAGKTLTPNELVGQPYVVKYGGENIKYGFGGRAVYHTEDNDEGLARGLSEGQQGHPWVVQPRDKTTYQVREWVRGTNLLRARKGAGRLMFHYATDPENGQTRVVLAGANIRPDHWKAAGNKDAVFQEIRVRDER